MRLVSAKVDQMQVFTRNKQRWNEDKCICECKGLIDKGICDKGFIWNLSNCECECDKSCDVREYLDYKNCKCRNMLVDKLLKKCRENIDEKELHSTELHSNKMIQNSTLNDYEKYVILVNAVPAQYIQYFLLYFS